MTDSYDDIINLPHPNSSTHPRMSVIDRAAQFAPFAALTGHEDAILETARLTESAIELDDDVKAEISKALQNIAESLPNYPPVQITYFLPDEKKIGGAYIPAVGIVKKIDDIRRIITMTNNTQIPIDNIYKIEAVPF